MKITQKHSLINQVKLFLILTMTTRNISENLVYPEYLKYDYTSDK